MNEGAPMMYHGGSGFGGPGVYVMGPMERQARQYALEPLASSRSGGGGGGSPGSAGTPRRWQPRRDRHNRDNTAFGYDSDDSSLSSNASSSNKSADKGESSSSSRAEGGAGGVGAGGGGYGAREWRGRRRDPRPQRRIAPERFLNAAYPFQVKFTPDDLLNGSKYDTLSQEIWDKFVKSQQTEETFRKKMNLWRYLYITIKSIFPRYGLYVVGSTMSGFGLESSDMDLCLHVRAHQHVEPRTHALLHLNYILGYIRSFDPGAELIQAKVPILKFRDVRNGLQVDLNCNNVVGIRNTDLLHCFSRMDWRVRPLVALMKLWAQAHNINDARQRTLSSYSLTLMVIHFLQNGAVPAVLPRAHESGAGASAASAASAAAVASAAASRPAVNKATLGELFLNMLQYYADFPFSKRAISIRAPRRTTRPAPRPASLICVEEPFDLSNTARSVYDPETFDKIVNTFRDSAARLAPALRLRDAWPATHSHPHHHPHPHHNHPHSHQHPQPQR